MLHNILIIRDLAMYLEAIVMLMSYMRILKH
uniref:Uncharacterized protein n=1 Tax=Podoviridae sp. ctZkC8 TaxID=2825259 RepID=A0A8S5UC88_9CAUD|nr:MAG TPA: hypothetical protein [Podoviridae sp. ctZkC8]